MEKELTSANRLIIPAEFKPVTSIPYDSTTERRRDYMRDQTLRLADDLRGTGVYIKMGSVLRACGYGLVEEIHERGLGVFADLRLQDESIIMSTDGFLLGEVRPEIVSVSCFTGTRAMETLKGALPDTEILGVPVIPGLGIDELEAIHGDLSRRAAIGNLVTFAIRAGLDGVLLLEPNDLSYMLQIVRTVFLGMGSDLSSEHACHVVAEDSILSTNPASVIHRGARRVIVSPTIMQVSNRRELVMRMIEGLEEQVARTA